MTRRTFLRAVAPFAVIALAVAGFSGAWMSGTPVLDGPGTMLWVDVVRRHSAPYFVDAMWAGTPPWALASSLPILWLVPLAKLVGTVGAVKLAVLAAQVVAGWGAYVLVSSLWRRPWTATAAGVVYAVHPLLVSHGALFGHVPTAWVMAALPWFVICLRGLIRSSHPGYVVAAAATAAFAVLQQPQHAPGVAVLAVCLVGVAAIRDRANARGLLGRASGAGVLAGGLAASWLLPFLRLGRTFALNPARLVETQLVHGDATQLGSVPQAFLNRSSGWTNASVSFTAADHFSNGTYYLGGVVLLLAAAGVLLLPRRDRDGDLSAMVLAGALCLWTSGAAVPLAQSEPVLRGNVLPFAVLGAAMGIVLGSLVRRLHLGRWAVVAAGVLAVALVASPYIAPFLVLRRIVPFADALRFPRLYPIAVLAFVVAGASPLAIAETWAAGRSRAAALAPALGIAVVALALVDAAPYRSAYRLDAPSRSDSYESVAARTPPETRVATREWWDPSQAAPFLRRGIELMTGWPHPLALSEQWQLAAGSWAAPHAYTLRALGLSGTDTVVHDRWHADVPGLRRTSGLWVTPNPHALGDVRAYERVVAVRDHALATEIAVEVAGRGVGVVDAGPAGTPPALRGELASARARRRWVTHGAIRYHPADADRTAGARFEAGADGLRGLALALDRNPGRAELSLTQGGRTITRVRTSGAGPDGLWRFPFSRIQRSRGERYAFTLRCPTCPSGRGPGLGSVEISSGGDLLVDGGLRRDRAATIYPVYDELPAAPKSTSTLSGEHTDGRWTIRADLARPALVVASAAAFPGWTATIDGRQAPVRRADGAFVGVAAPAGRHTIAFVYRRPLASTIGRIVTAASVLLAGVILVGAWRRQRERFTRGTGPVSPGVFGGASTATTSSAAPRPRRRD